jgi:murein DD-endopeptidase MepM/ murein hydrolase activator NlpD
VPRRIAAALSLLLVAPLLAHGESLAEAARREQARREKLKAQGAPATKVVTEAELAASKGDLVSVPASPTARPSPRTPAPGPGQGGAREGAVSAQDDAEAYWRSRAANARARLEHAEAVYAALDRQIRLGQPGQLDENGQIRMYSQAQLKRRADEAQAEVEAARKDLERTLDDGRRAGALPGWLR